METTVVNVGKYRFQIIDNSLFYDGKVYSRNFKIGGNIPDCVNVSISYRDGQPLASIPHVLYDPECSFNTPLDKGGGSVVMIKTLLNHIQQVLPENHRR